MHNPEDDLDLNALLNADAGISALARGTSTSSAASSKTDEDAYVSANEGASDASVDDDHDDGAIAPGSSGAPSTSSERGASLGQ